MYLYQILLGVSLSCITCISYNLRALSGGATESIGNLKISSTSAFCNGGIRIPVLAGRSPASMGSTILEYLELTHHLTGETSKLGGLANLYNVHHNYKITGSIPASFSTDKLVTFSAENNGFKERWPEFSATLTQSDLAWLFQLQSQEQHGALEMEFSVSRFLTFQCAMRR
jgi:hypothetical protein